MEGDYYVCVCVVYCCCLGISLCVVVIIVMRTFFTYEKHLNAIVTYCTYMMIQRYTVLRNNVFSPCVTVSCCCCYYCFHYDADNDDNYARIQ